MIDYEKLLGFLNVQDLDVRELFLLYTLHIKNEQVAPELDGQMNLYYKRNKNKGAGFVKMVEDLEERGFLTILKKNEDGSIDVKNLKIEEKFVNLLFCDPNSIWKEFLLRYPLKGISPDGMSYFPSKRIEKQDEENFKKKILKNVNKFEASQIIYIMEDMFDWNPKIQQPEKFATIGISRFILNWDTILSEWKKEQEEIDKGNWQSTRL